MTEPIIMFSPENHAKKIDNRLGTAQTHALRYFEKDGVHAGTWECRAGEFTIEAHPVNEVCHILEGEAQIFGPDGESRTVVPGDSFFIPKGSPSTWRVKKFVKKTYMVSS